MPWPGRKSARCAKGFGMADGDWYYRIDDEVRGPVSINFLCTAYAKGKLRSRDCIRFRETGEWKAANYFRQMVQARDKYRKLLEKQKSTKQKTGLPDIGDETDHAIEAPTDLKNPVDNPLQSDPWYQILTQLLTEAGLVPDPVDLEDRVWFMWVGRKLGPFSFLDLVKMGQEGTLKVTDWVSHADSEDWTPLSPEAEAQVENDELSDSDTAVSVSDSNMFALSDSGEMAPVEPRSNDPAPERQAAVPGPDDSAWMSGQSGGSQVSASDSDMYGLLSEPEPPRNQPPAVAPYQRKIKQAPLKLPDQIPSAALTQPMSADSDDDEVDQAAKAAAQLLISPTKKQEPATSLGVGGGPGSPHLPGGEKKPLVDRIKEAGPRGWAQMAGGAIVLLYVLNFLASLLPASDHASYQEFLRVYAEAKTLRDAESTQGDEWKKFFYESIPQLQQVLIPMALDPPEADTGRFHLLEGGKQLLMDLEYRKVRTAEYKPWFMQELFKAATELGYDPPPDVPEGAPPVPGEGYGGDPSDPGST